MNPDRFAFVLLLNGRRLFAFDGDNLSREAQHHTLIGYCQGLGDSWQYDDFDLAKGDYALPRLTFN